MTSELLGHKLTTVGIPQRVPRDSLVNTLESGSAAEVAKWRKYFPPAHRFPDQFLDSLPCMAEELNLTWKEII